MQKSRLRNFLRKIMLPIAQIDMELPKSGKILDLGCGEGVIASFLSETKKRNVVGVDLEIKRLPGSKQ